MEAGRELDALVAEKVMGWTYQESSFLGVSKFWRIGPKGVIEIEEWRPSTKIASAWAVVEKLKEFISEKDLAPDLFHVNFRIEYNGDNWWAGFTEREPEGVASFGPITGIGESAPHAICLAALKAVGI